MSHEDNRDAFDEVGVFVGKDSETAETSEKTNFQRKHLTMNTRVSHWDNTDAFSKVEISRKRIQKQPWKEQKNCSNCSTIFKKKIHFLYCNFCRLYEFFFQFYSNEDFKSSFQRTLQFSFQMRQSSRHLSRFKMLTISSQLLNHLISNTDECDNNFWTKWTILSQILMSDLAAISNWTISFQINDGDFLTITEPSHFKYWWVT